MKEVIKIKNNAEISFFAAVKHNDFLYCSSWNSNGLYKIECNHGYYKLIKKFEDESDKVNLHNIAVKDVDSIWFIPCKGSTKIAKFELNSNSLTYYDLPRSNHKTASVQFISAYLINKFIWLIPFGFDAIVKIDTVNGEVNRYDLFSDDIVWANENDYNFSGSVQIGNNIVILRKDCQSILIFNIESLNIKKVDLNLPEEQFSIVNHDDDIYFVSSNNIYCTNFYELNKVNHVMSLNITDTVKGKVMAISGNIYIFPFRGRKVYIYDTKSKMLSSIILESDISDLRYQNSIHFDSGTIINSDVRGMSLLKVSNQGDVERLKWMETTEDEINALMFMVNDNAL